jgi:glycosyltransferase involved in cell wall biosynthesis
MNILMLAPEPFFEARGTPISVYLRLHQLVRLGHAVTVLTYHVGQPVELPGVRVARIPNVPFIRHVRPGPSWAKPLLDFLLFLLALAHLLQGTYHVIHTHEEAAALGLLLAALFRKPHVYDMHSSLPRQVRASRYGRVPLLVWAFERLERRVLRACAAVITVADDLDALVRQRAPQAVSVRLDNLPVHALGVRADPALAATVRDRLPLDGRACIVYAGNFEASQGLDLLLEAAAAVVRQEPRSLFVWVGGQPDQVRAWRARISALGLQGHVHLVGAVPLAEALAYVELADILVSPRRAGTTVPLKLYTYLQAGKPIVATRLGAHTQVLTSATALLVEPTADGLAGGLLSLIADPAARARLGAQARALALDKYQLPDQLDRLAGLYRSLDRAGSPAAARPSVT